MIPSIDWAKKYKLVVRSYSHNNKSFLKSKIKELANKMIVDPIIDDMRANNVHRKIYESVIVESVSIEDDMIRIRIHSEYFAENGFDVALAREKGTEDHFIQPLRYASQFTNVDPNLVSNLPKALSWIQNGKRRFSKGHKVSGLPKLNTIERIVEKNQYDLQQAINEEFKKWKKGLFS
jgi:hypothetical protein